MTPWNARSRLILREAVALARQGLLLSRVSDPLREYAPSGALTVFVHGYMATGGVFEPMAEHLAATGTASRQLHFSYMPVGSVAALAHRLDAKIRAAHGDGPVHIVAHSMGGIVARYYRQVLGRPVERMVCLATPHAGTRMAAALAAGLPLARELAPGSPTLRLLHTTRDRLEGTTVCSLVAVHDTVVTPVDSAALDGHETVRLAGVGHHGILFSREAWAHTTRVLRSAPRPHARYG